MLCNQGIGIPPALADRSSRSATGCHRFPASASSEAEHRCRPGTPPARSEIVVSTPHARLAMQIGGRGFLEAHPPNDVTGARFEGRFVIYSMMSHGSPVFGDDVSLFERDGAAQHGLGPGSAHFIAMRSGFGLESFHTGDDEFVGHLYARTSARTRLRIYFDAAPDGSRSFEDRDSFTRGRLIATYRAE